MTTDRKSRPSERIFRGPDVFCLLWLPSLSVFSAAISAFICSMSSADSRSHFSLCHKRHILGPLQVAGFTHSAVPPLPNKTASLGFAGAPISFSAEPSKSAPIGPPSKKGTQSLTARKRNRRFRQKMNLPCCLMDETRLRRPCSHWEPFYCRLLQFAVY